MYAEGTYLTSYCNNYMKRERKFRTGRRILAAALVSCAVGAIVFTVGRLTFGSAVITGKNPAADGREKFPHVIWDKLMVNDAPAASYNILKDSASGQAVFNELVHKNVTDAEAVIEEARPPIVFVDAGHGGEDGGCVSGGIMEKTVNLEIARLVKQRLEESGYIVMMSRETDGYISKEDRVEMANKAKADIYVSIHQNSSEDKSVSGMEVWYDGTDSERDSERLAQLVRQQTKKTTESVERELRGNADFHVTGSTLMPACLVETGFLTNAAERGRLASREYQEKIADGIVNGIEYYFYPKTMYLTFDDGPSEENTLRILDILKERGIKATFFLVGENVRKYPEIARRIAEEGHTIGIHSDSHNYDVIYESVESFINDFEDAHKTVYEVTGVDAKLFRFPGGSVNAYNEKVRAEIIEEMTQRGYIYYDWNASLGDAESKKEIECAKLVENGITSTLGREKVVMLAHDVVYNTGLCLEELIDSFPEYDMRALDENVVPIQF